MRISGREIGPDHPPYVIAELGVNHDGSPERALELTRAAADAGADAVKLQLFRADLLMSRASRLATYQAEAGESDPLAMLRRLEMPIKAMEPVVALAHDRGIHAIVTVFSTELVEEAERLPWDAYKTASPDVIHRPLLERLAATGRPLIISTGASEPGEIERALGWLRRARERTALLQCVSSYPTPPEHAELGGIQALRALFDGPVGYSDHTASIETGATAVALGAHILEKHFTYSRAATGPDHAASLEPRALAEYVCLARAVPSGVRRAPAPHPSPVKRVIAIERDVRQVSRQSIVSRRAMPKGHVITPADLTVKRPGIGFPPFEMGLLVGRTLARDVSADTPLVRDDLR